jgi:hypothetical protein
MVQKPLLRQCDYTGMWIETVPFFCLTNRTAPHLRVRRGISKLPRLCAVVAFSSKPDEAEHCTCGHESNNPVRSAR